MSDVVVPDEKWCFPLTIFSGLLVKKVHRSSPGRESVPCKLEKPAAIYDYCIGFHPANPMTTMSTSNNGQI